MAVVDLNIAAVYQSGIVDYPGSKTAGKAVGIVQIMSSAAVDVYNCPAFAPKKFILINPMVKPGIVNRKIIGIFLGSAVGISGGAEIGAINPGVTTVPINIVLKGQNSTIVSTISVIAGIGNHPRRI